MESLVVRIDGKHSIIVEAFLTVEEGVSDREHPVTATAKLSQRVYLAKRTINGDHEMIPLDEPVILFRSRDRLALKLLHHYWDLCQQDGATEYQLETVQEQINKFAEFAKSHPETMKQPGITRGH